jgi:hypothetical protein
MAIRQPLSTGTSESSIIFYNGGHNHDGISSALISTAKYSIYDFTTDFIGTDLRQSVQSENFRKFKNVIADIVKTDVLTTAGITLTPNQVRAENISAGAVTATSLAANIVLVNNVIKSNNYVIGVSGWAINSNGTAEFANTSIRGAIVANSVSTLGVDIFSNGTLAANSFTLYGNGAIVTSSGKFAVDADGNLFSNSATITGTVTATSVSTPGIDIDSSGNLTSNASTFGIYANGAIFTSSGNFSVNASGVLSATGAIVRGEISSGTFVTHNRFGVDINYTRPTVLIDNTNNEFALNTTGGGIRLNGNQWLAYRSGDSFYRMNLDFGAASYSFLGSFYIDGTLQSSSLSTGAITASGVTYNPSNLVGGFPIAFGYDLGSGQLRAIVNNDTNVYFSLTKTFISDRRLKNNIEPISSTVLDRFYLIKTYEFDWNDKTPEHVRKWGRTVGVIADELKELYPAAVLNDESYEGWVHRYDEHPEGFSLEEMEKFGSDYYEFISGEGVWQKPRYASVDYSALIPHLISAIHDLNNRVKELENEV